MLAASTPGAPSGTTEQLETQMSAPEVRLGPAVLDRSVEIVPPGTDVNPDNAGAAAGPRPWPTRGSASSCRGGCPAAILPGAATGTITESAPEPVFSCRRPMLPGTVAKGAPDR